MNGAVTRDVATSGASSWCPCGYTRGTYIHPPVCWDLYKVQCMHEAGFVPVLMIPEKSGRETTTLLRNIMLVPSSPPQIGPNTGATDTARPASRSALPASRSALPAAPPATDTAPLDESGSHLTATAAVANTFDTRRPMLYARHASKWNAMRDRSRLHEIVSFEALLTKPDRHWMLLKELAQLQGHGVTVGIGVAAAHPQKHRHEAALKIILGRYKLLVDITNPSPVTQLDLTRVPRAHAVYVDRYLFEVARRCLGRRLHVPEAQLLYSLLERRLPLDRSTPEGTLQLSTWRAAGSYLEMRIQSTKEQKPGREPDLRPQVAAVMHDVLREVGAGQEVSGGLGPGNLLADARRQQLLPSSCAVS